MARWLVVALSAMLIFFTGSPLKASKDRVRPSALAGSWYPADAAELGALVDRLLDSVEPRVTLASPPRALIVPHAAYAYSGPTAAQGFALIRGQAFERVLLLAPAHRSGFAGLSIADVEAYETPLGELPLDLDAIAQLRVSDLVSANPDAHTQEHSIEIELPFLQRALAPGWKLIPVLVGRLDEQDYGRAADLLRPLADGHTLVVVSSDFTHFGPRFGYLPFPLDPRTPERLRALDDGAIDRIRAIDARGLLDYQLETGITVCGIRPIALLLSMLPPDAGIEPVTYATSGALTGDFDNSVSYAALAVTTAEPIAGLGGKPTAAVESEFDTGQLELLHRLARAGIDRAVLGQETPGDPDLEQLEDAIPDTLKQPAGAFVTLKRQGQLRGCIGYIEARKPLYRAVAENGYNAARRDQRFLPVEPGELDDLTIEVSVLTPPRRIETYADFRVGEQGVILTKDGRRAVFLPEVATEQGWDRDQTLTQLATKAGLPPDAWRNGAEFRVFESIHYAAPYVDPNAPAAGGKPSGPSPMSSGHQGLELSR